MAASELPRYVPQTGGYPREIFGKERCDEKYLCNFCNNVLREPVQSYCGHRFCKSCMDTNISSGDQIRCTQCEKEEHESEDLSIINKDQIFPDNAIRREMGKLNVVCANTDCGWKGRFRQYEEHYPSCEFFRVKCPRCQMSVLSKFAQEHLEKECENAKVICQLCGRDFYRKDLKNHQMIKCQAEQIQCPVGCGMIARKDFQEHFREMKHDVWLMQELEKIRNVMGEIQQPLGQLTDEVIPGVATMNDKITAIEQQIQELLSRQDGAGTGAGLGNIDSKIRQVVEMQLQSVNERLDVKTGTFEGIASALHRELEKTITAVEKLERHRLNMLSDIQQNQNKIKALERSIALKDMMMAEMELKTQSMESASFDGTFMWRVPEFNKKHQEALHGRTISIYSPPFYTSRRGYKMCARLYPNGDGMGKGSHLSLFFVVMRGNHDALLKWPFGQRVTFCLINQNGGDHVIDSFRPDPQSSSFKRPTSDMNIASGCPLFIRLEMLQNPNNGFVKDDTMFLKIAVDTTDLADPISSFDERIKPQS